MNLTKTTIYCLQILTILPLVTNSQTILLEDEFHTLENWVLMESQSDYTQPTPMKIVQVPDVPKNHGPAVLDIQGKRVVVFARDQIVSDCLIEILWRDVDPIHEDTDGPLMARAQLPPNSEIQLSLPTGEGLYWLEHDSDAGFQLKTQENFNQETTLARLNHAHKTSGNWNKNGWIWHKWLLQGNQLKATYWPEGGEDPGWLLETGDNKFQFGGVGFRIWTGHAQIAFIRITALPNTRNEALGRIHFNTLQQIFDQQEPVPFTLFVLPGIKQENLQTKISLTGNQKTDKHLTQTISLSNRIKTISSFWETKNLADGRYTITASLNRNNATISTDSIAFDILSRRKSKQYLKKLSQKLKTLTHKIKQTQEKKIETAYQQVVLTGARHAIKFINTDLRDGRLKRARSKIEYYLTAVEKANNELETMLATPAAFRYRQVNRSELKNLSIKNGAFYSGRAPVMLCGLVGWNDVIEDIPLLPALGYNLAAIEIGPSATVLGPEETDLSAEFIKQRVSRALKLARENNVAIMLLVSPHYFPEWAFQAYPEVKSCGHGFLKYCIENPKARKILERHLRFLIAEIKDEPALHSYCLANEPQFVERCQFSRKKFQIWLENYYHSIHRLNRSWGRDFAEFQQIEIPADNETNPAIRYDWYTFHGNQVTEFFSWMKEIIRAADPHRPVHIKFMMDVFAPDEGRYGIDREALGKLCEISGCDASTSYPDHSGRFAAEFWRVTMFYDLLRSFEPGKPIFNSEYHIIRDNDLRVDYPANYIRTSLWEATLHGQGAYAFWVWGKKESHPDLVGNILHRPAANESAGRTSLDLQRLVPHFVTLSQAKSPVALLFSRTSKLLSGAHYADELQKAYLGLLFQGLPVRFITERQILEGNLHDIDLLIVPGADYVREDVFHKIAHFVYDGGAMLSTADAFRYNEHGKARRQVAFIDGLRMNRLNTPLLTGNLNLQAIEQLQLATPLSEKNYHALLNLLIDAAGIERPVQVVDSCGKSIWGVEARSVIQDNEAFISVVNWLKQPQEVNLLINRSIQSITNLVTNQPHQSPTIQLTPLEPILLRVRF